jgi:hypothetical protein
MPHAPVRSRSRILTSLSALSFALLAFLTLALAPSSRAAQAPASPTPAPLGELLGTVWSGHPVTFGFLTERGHQFIAYYDADRRITVLGRKLSTPASAWTRIQPPGIPNPPRKRDSNVVAWDSHNTLRLALDRDGNLHLSGNMHADPLVYYRTRVPFDVSTLERIDRMIGEREKRCTYPVFFKDASGNLLFRYRDGSSGNGSDLYNRYDTGTRTWSRLLATPLLEGEGERNAYAGEPTLGPDGRFHLVWMWRETPDCATNHTLSYARSPDLIHWENSRGEPLTLPITLKTGEVIDGTQPGGGLINMSYLLGFDAQKRPVVAYHRYDAQNHSQAYLARPNATGPWTQSVLSTWDFKWAFSGGGSIDSEVTLGRPRLVDPHTFQIDYSSKVAGSGRWTVDADTLARTGQLPPAPSTLPTSLRRIQSPTPGMEVQILQSSAGPRRWVLRWETLGRNRDKPRDFIPPPTELRLYELPAAEPPTAQRVGS